MTGLDLDRIEAAARAATPGPWVPAVPADDDPATVSEWMPLAAANPDDRAAGSLHVVWAVDDPRAGVAITAITGDGPTGAENAAYIALMDPATTLALVARLREAEAAVERVRALHHRRPHRLGDGVAHGQTEFPDLCDYDHQRWPCQTIRAITTGDPS